MRRLFWVLAPLALVAAACAGTTSEGPDDGFTSVDTGGDTVAAPDLYEGPVEWQPPPHTPRNPVDLDLAAIPEDETVFPAGAMAGDPTAESMLLWTLATQPEGLRLKVWLPDIEADRPERVDLLFDEAVVAEEGGYVHKRVFDVLPGRRHAYAFFREAGDEGAAVRSRVGRFTAAPPEAALVRLTISGTHGTNERFAPYPALVANAAFAPFDLYLHLGDSIYADGSRDLGEYRRMWVENWRSEGFRAVLAQAAYLPVWDDHEVTNNYDPETEDPEIIEWGIRSFYDSNPLEAAPEGHYRTWRWGDTVEFFALDARSERRPSTRLESDAQYLSWTQMQWLQEGLLRSTATFKLILNSVPIIDFHGLWDLASEDRWEGYAAQRDELIAFLTNNPVENVFFATGDFHMATVGRLDAPDGAGHDLWEFMLGPGSQSNPLGNRRAMIETLGEENDPLPPDQFLWGYPEALLSYVDFDPIAQPPTMTLRYYDLEGAPLFRAVFAEGALVSEEHF